MKQLFLLILLFFTSLTYSQNHNTLLIIGNSRSTNMNGFPSDSIAKDLGCTHHVNRSVGGTKTETILASIDSGLILAGDSLRAIIFQDIANNGDGKTDYHITARQTDSIVLKCLQHVSADSFYFVQAGPSSNVISVGDSAVINLTATRGSRNKNTVLQAMEYAIAAKYGVRWVSFYDYFSRSHVDSLQFISTPYTTDGTHYTSLAYQIIRIAIRNAKRLYNKQIVYGNGIEGSWKCWRKTGSAVITGDTNSGQLTIPSGDTVVMPCKGIGFGVKKVSITPYLASGSVSIYTKYSDQWFKQNESSLTWSAYDSTEKTNKNMCQVMIVATINTVVDSFLFRWVSVTDTIHRKKIFGNGLNQVRDWHKDATISKVNGSWAIGGYINVPTSDDGSLYRTILRFGFDYDIPSKAIIDSAKLNLYVYQSPSSGSVKCRMRPLLTENGVSRYWDECTEIVPTYGQATYYYARSPFTKWKSDSLVGTLDMSADSVVWTANTGVAKYTKHTVNVTNLVSKAVNNYSSYYGWLIDGTGGTSTIFVNYYSQNTTGADSPYRPYLEVWYREPSNKKSTGNNRISVSVGTGL